MDDATDISPRLYGSERQPWNTTSDDVPRVKPPRIPVSPALSVGAGPASFSPTHSPSVNKEELDKSWELRGSKDEIKAYHREETSSNLPPALEEAAGTVSRLAAKLKEGAAVVAQQEREKAALAADAHAHAAQHLQKEAALSARAKVVEVQLEDTHAALQGAQKAQREAAAVAAELREQLVTMREDRDAALSKLDKASRMLREACARAEATAAERDAARREAQIAREAATEASARLREAEMLHDALKHREAALVKAQAAVDIEATKVQRSLLECQRREAEAAMRERNAEAKERIVESKSASLDARSGELSGREAAVAALAARVERERAELQSCRQDLRRESTDLEAREEALKIAEGQVQNARNDIAKERAQLAKEKHEASVECGQAAARAALAQKEAEEAIRKAADAEAAAQSAYDRAIFEERRLREAQKQCSEEQIRMKELQAENSRLTDEIALKRKDVLDAQEEAKARRGAIDAAIKAAAADRREAEQQHEAVLRERAILEERIKALTQKERQALEAAEEARKEQVLLSCARRDSSRAAAEMQRRHLEAAVQLEGPSPGGAVHATYEAVREEQVLRLSSETHNEYHQSPPVSPRGRPSSGSSNIANTNTTFAASATVAAETAPEPLLRETCNAVASEVESRLERWKEQLQMQDREGYTHAPPVGEPSLAPTSARPTENIDDDLKLLGGGNRRYDGYSENWPGIFSFPTK